MHPHRRMSDASRRLLIACAAVAAAGALCGPATAGTFPVRICGSSPRDPGDGLTWAANAPLVATAQCPYFPGAGLEVYAPENKTVGNGATAAFKTTAPAGVTVYSIHVQGAYSDGIGTGGWWGEFYWNGGPGPVGRSGPLSDAQFNGGGCCSQTNLKSRVIGWFIACNRSSCSSGASGRVRGMGELDLVGEEDRAPAIIASGGDNLWYQAGWVRGRWPVVVCGERPVGGVRRRGGVRQPAGDRDPHSGHRAESARVAAVPAAKRPWHGGHQRLRRQPGTRGGGDAAAAVGHQHRRRHGESDEDRLRRRQRAVGVAVRADRRTVDRWHAVCNGDRVRRSVWRFGHRLLTRRCPVSVVPRGEHPGPGRGVGCP